MALRFILGHSGSGKSEWIYKALGGASAPGAGTPLLVVPEQSSLQVQGELLDSLPQGSMMAVEVLSFQRLAFRLSDYLGIAGKTLLDDYGQQMLIRRLIDKEPEAYPLLSGNFRKKGYAGELKQLMEELSRYEVDSGRLRELGEQLRRDAKGGLLPAKLEETARLKDAFEGAISGSYITMVSMLELLKKKIHAIGFLKQADIYIDGFYSFTPIQYAILRELAASARQVAVAVAIDRQAYEAKQLPESHLYWEAKETIHRIRMLAYEERVEELDPVMLFDSGAARSDRPALVHLGRHFFQYPLKPFSGAASGITLCRSSSIKKELAFVADTVWHLAREKGMRFKDIGILCGATQSYERLMDEVFKKNGIPYHLDAKRPLREHPLSIWIMALLDLCAYGFQVDTVIPLLKSPLGGWEEESIDRMENYALAYGLKGRKAWQKPFSRRIPGIRTDKEHPDHQAALAALNEEKEHVLHPVFDAVDKLAGSMATAERLKRFVEVLEDNGMEEKISAMADAYGAEGRLDQERAYRQAYGMMMDLFDQMHDMLGDEVLSPKEFKQLLEAGLDQRTIGTVPAGIDEVLAGDVHRSRIGEKRAIFLLGVNEGLVPMLEEKAGFITDRDRMLAKDHGLDLAPSAEKQLFREPLNILMNMLRATERLYISYPATGSDGGAARPSYIIHQLRRMFPGARMVDVDRETEGRITAGSPEAAFERMLEGLGRHVDKEDYQQAYLWFREEADYAARLETGMKAVSAYAPDPPMAQVNARLLYGDTPSYSVTRLEAYAQCPFRFFMEHGIGARDRQQYQVDAMSIGSLFHKALELFTRQVVEAGNDWSRMDSVEQGRLIDRIVDDLVSEEDRDVYLSTARNRHLVQRVKRIAKRAVWAASRQITKGDFRPEGIEMRFKGGEKVKALTLPLENGGEMRLNGVIDRVDACRFGDETYIMVIDYKSGVKKVDLTELYHGIQLQLVMYLNAAQEVKAAEGQQTVLPAGAFYFHIEDPVVDGGTFEDEPGLEKAILEKMKLDGYLLKDKAVLARLDKEMAQKSEVFKVSYKKDGDFASSPHLLVAEEFEALQRHARHKAMAIGNTIMEGRIEASPYRLKEAAACDYCLYKAVCGFDARKPGCRFRELEKIDSVEHFL